MLKLSSRILIALVALSIACVSVPPRKTSTISLDPSVVANNYDALSEIILEEAKNNGFGNPTSVKPSQYNNWEGKWNFITDNDVFKVDIQKDGEKYSLFMHGRAMSGNVDGAINAITARVAQLQAVSK